MRRRRGRRGRLQRPARWRAVRARGAARHADAAARAARAGDIGDRDRDRLGGAAGPPDVLDPALRSAHLGDRLGADPRADRGFRLDPLRPPDRARPCPPPGGGMRLLAPIIVFTVLGFVAIAYPQILGNGKGIVQITLVGRLSAATLAALLVLKPLATAAASAAARREGCSRRRCPSACCSAACSATPGRSCGRGRRSPSTRSSAARPCSERRCKRRSRLS